MINKFLIIFSLFLCNSCEFRRSLKEDVNLSYSDGRIEAKITLSERVVRYHQKHPRYYYYGVLNFRAISTDTDSEEVLFVVREGERSQIYMDTIASASPTWYYTLKNGRVYVVFNHPDIDWSKVKVVAESRISDLQKNLSSGVVLSK